MSVLRILAFILKFTIGSALFGAVAILVCYVIYSDDLPDVTELKDIRLQTPLQIRSIDGELIASFGERRRIPLKYEDIPESVIKAVIATEDSRFYEHYGIDPIGILRALYIAAKSGTLSQGGSTITQQVAKNFFLTPERSIARKIREMILALRMERELSKEEILTLYLNKIYFGSRAYGVGSAAFTFFGKTANELTLSESALLAGLPNAPSAYNPIYSPDKALSRRNWVLHRMYDQNYITQDEYSAAIAEPLEVSYHVPKIEFSAPYIAEMVRQYMYDRFGENAYTDGYTVYTTISKKEQNAATDAMVKGVIDYDMRHGYRGPEKVLWEPEDEAWDTEKITQFLTKNPRYTGMLAAVVIESKDKSATALLANGNKIVIDYEGVKWARPYINDSSQGEVPTTVSSVVKVGQQIRVRQINKNWILAQIPAVNGSLVTLNFDTGAVKALIGGIDFTLSKFNRATQAFRQIGSNIKPFIYTAGLEKGLTMATLLNDAPILRTNAGSDAWRPRNSPAVYAGPLRLRVGLGMSKNVMMVRATRAMGINYAAEYLERFGFPKNNISPNESLALGSASFTPMQVARGYSVIANGGYLVSPYFIDRIEFAEGGILYKHIPEIACNDCLQLLSSPKLEEGEIALDKVEEVAITSGQEEPEQEKLTAEGSIALPNANISFERMSLEEQAKITEENRLIEELKKNQPVYAPQVISSEAAFIIKDGLKTAVWGERDRDWLGTGWRSRDLNRHDIGGKTGTTNLVKDVWFSGFGGKYVTTVWLGFDDHRRELGRARRSLADPNGPVVAEGGAVTANPIWNEYMGNILKGVPEHVDLKPNTVVNVLIDKKTGLLAPAGPNTISEFFIEGTEPQTYMKVEVTTKVTDSQGNTSELF